MGRKSKRVYSVLSCDMESDGSNDVNVIGSWRNEDDAIDACADYIIERIHIRSDIRYALYNDVNHGRALRRELKEKSNVSYSRLKRMFDLSDGWSLPKKVLDVLRAYLRWNIRCDGSYTIDTDMFSEFGRETFMFRLQENELY